MGNEALPIRIEELLEHAGWVRVLARTLVADSGAAEDLVQETWLAALGHPPQERRNLRAWLTRVLTNAARQRGRHEAPRRALETAAGRGRASESHESPDQLAAQVETQRELARHVLALEEPYRRTVILRYWRGLDSAEIARREGVAHGTVRWRLKQGLDQLREGLDASHGGDRRAWCLALVPLLERGVAEAGTLSLPALVVHALASSLALKLCVSALALTLALLGLFASGILTSESDGELRSALARAPDANAVDAPDPVTPISTSEPGAARVAVSQAAQDRVPASALPQDLSKTRVTALIVDDHGRPVVGATLSTTYAHLMYPDGRGEAQATSDTAGELTLEFVPVAPGLAVDLLVRAAGHASTGVETAARAGEVVHLGEIALAPGGDIAGRVVDEHGAPLAGASVEPGPARIPGGDLERARREHGFGLDAWSSARTGEDGSFLLRGVAVGRWRVWAAQEGRLVGVSDSLELAAGARLEGVELVLVPLPREDVIAGIVLDPEGVPVPWAGVTFEYETWFSSGSHMAVTDTAGRFVELCDPRSPRTVRVSDPKGRYGELVLRRVRPGTTDLVARFSAPVMLVLDVRGPGGAVLQDAHVTLFDADRERPFGTRHVRGADDELRVTAPGERFLAVVAADGHAERELGPFDPGALPERVECVLAELPGVRGSVQAGGAPRAGARVSLVAEETGHALQDGFPVRSTSEALVTAASDADGRFMATLRERGGYYLRVEADGFAALERGPLSIDPSHGLDVGVLELSMGGAIEGRVLGPDGRVAGAVVAISRGDGHARTQRVGPDGSFRFERLIPGPWQVELRDEELVPGRSTYESSLRRRPARIPANCSVTEGGTTRFDLALDGQQQYHLEGTLLVDGVPAVGWTASLEDAELSDGLLVTSEEERARTGPDGVFRLSRPQPGRYLLVLAGGADASLCTEVELAEGTATWSEAIELATLDVEGLPTDREQLPAALVLWERGELFAVAPLFAAEDGTARGLTVPAGKARIVRFEPLDALQDPRSLPTWLSLELPAGETTLARIP